MTPRSRACFIRHLGPTLHSALESSVNGYDCDPNCPKREEIAAFFRFIGETKPLVLGP